MNTLVEELRGHYAKPAGAKGRNPFADPMLGEREERKEVQLENEDWCATLWQAGETKWDLAREFNVHSKTIEKWITAGIKRAKGG